MTETESDDSQAMAGDRLQDQVAWVGYLYPGWEVSISTTETEVTWTAKRRDPPTLEQILCGVMPTVEAGSGLDLAGELELQAEVCRINRFQ